ncbi:hypothetical protein NEOLEDRAFT_1130388 [Neolentinus lepideus HHB14362 ss-1]|uniref:Uncharacterized protein n=1 Tax=Neolentinus lepideus HHB14362 ss-1 TaxID=1314782 RepID=A0A165UB13_9AGAM|nr:hypothetical protein NEOLEDRAFT_1130388 [Neolentinus lepideus HHB14362 ss-1]
MVLKTRNCGKRAQSIDKDHAADVYDRRRSRFKPQAAIHHLCAALLQRARNRMLRKKRSSTIWKIGTQHTAAADREASGSRPGRCTQSRVIAEHLHAPHSLSNVAYITQQSRRIFRDIRKRLRNPSFTQLQKERYQAHCRHIHWRFGGNRTTSKLQLVRELLRIKHRLGQYEDPDEVLHRHSERTYTDDNLPRGSSDAEEGSVYRTAPSSPISPQRLVDAEDIRHSSPSSYSLANSVTLDPGSSRRDSFLSLQTDDDDTLVDADLGYDESEMDERMQWFVKTHLAEGLEKGVSLQSIFKRAVYERDVLEQRAIVLQQRLQEALEGMRALHVRLQDALQDMRDGEVLLAGVRQLHTAIAQLCIRLGGTRRQGSEWLLEDVQLQLEEAEVLIMLLGEMEEENEESDEKEEMQLEWAVVRVRKKLRAARHAVWVLEEQLRDLEGDVRAVMSVAPEEN